MRMFKVTGCGMPHLDGCLGSRAGSQSRDAIGQDRVGSDHSKPLRPGQSNRCQVMCLGEQERLCHALIIMVNIMSCLAMHTV